VFTATPLAVILHGRWPMSAAVKVRVPRSARDPQDSGAVI